MENQPAGCVWELAVVDFERRAWIEDVLANPDGPDLERYLAPLRRGRVAPSRRAAFARVLGEPSFAGLEPGAEAALEVFLALWRGRRVRAAVPEGRRVALVAPGAASSSANITAGAARELDPALDPALLHLSSSPVENCRSWRDGEDQGFFREAGSYDRPALRAETAARAGAGTGTRS